MTALDRVMAEPASLAARYALLAEWQATNNPQAELLEVQLEDRQLTGENRRSDRAHQLRSASDRLLRAHGRAWAGRAADLVTRYRFRRGLVAQVDLPGDRFLAVLPELLSLAPIQQVCLLPPFPPVADLARSPLVARLSSLRFENARTACGDAGAIALAESPHVANLTDLSLVECGVSRAGVEAIAASRYLVRARRINLAHNPCDPSPHVIDEGDGEWLAHRPPLAAELEERFGTRPWLAMPDGYLPTWPPDPDELALIHDYVSDRELAALEQLAIEVDRLAAGNDEDQLVAGARRQRLLIELDVHGLLGGEPAIGRRLADHATLRTYHDACVEVMRYHASAARIRLVGKSTPHKPIDGHISLDWFRTPSRYTPAGVSPHDWLALCEANFLTPRAEGNGTRFVRLEGRLHVLSYRIEATAEPKLWRALPAGQTEATAANDPTAHARQLASDLLDEMDHPKPAEREAYEALKEREDREALERLHIATGQFAPHPMFARLLANMAAEIERANPPEGAFPVIAMRFQYKGHQGTLQFAASPNKPARRYIELSLHSKSGLSTSCAMLDTGSNAEIVRYLRRPDLVEEMVATAEERIISLARNRLA